MNLESFSQKTLEGIQILSLPTISPLQLEKLYLFQNILIKWNKKINVTAHRDEFESLEKNFIDCLALTSLIDSSDNVLDVGSGAGFPGLVLKLSIPNLKISLIESNLKKCAFLQNVISELSLDGIEVVSSRFEEKICNSIFSDKFDVIVSRATIPIKNFFPLLTKNIKKNKKVILMIGKSDFSEEFFEGFALENKFFYQLPFSKLERGIFSFRKI